MKKEGISTTQLAKICGVSQGTVDRALNNRNGIRTETREKILAAAKEYGYRPEHIKDKDGNKRMLIGVVVFDMDNQYFVDIIACLEKSFAAKGYSVVVMMSGKDNIREIECIKNLYCMPVDGLVICPINWGEEYEKFLLSLNIPVVTIGNRLNTIPFVGINDALAMQDVVDYAVSRGYGRLIYVKPNFKEKNAYAQSERCCSFFRRCHELQVDYAVTGFSEAEEALDETNKNAFICPTDVFALHLLSLAERKSVGLIGFDNLRLIKELTLKLDSVDYDMNMMARFIVEYILENKPIDGLIKHRLVKRGSL